MHIGALEFGFEVFLTVVYTILAAGFVGFMIPAAYFTAQTGVFSLLWIGAFVFIGLAVMFSIGLFISDRIG